MQNSTLQIIEQRRSLRKYAETPISEEEKTAILHAAMRAPTAGNLMLYSIIEIASQELKERLAVTCDHQPFIAKAPLVLLFVADYQRMFDYFQYCEVEKTCRERGVEPRLPQEGDLLLACCDALIAAQNAVVAAESMKIGSCYIGDILENYETHQQLLNLPPYVLPITMLCFGKAAVEKEEHRLTSRYDPRFIVFKDGYHRLSPQEIIEMMAPVSQHAHPDLPLEQAVKATGNDVYFRKFVSEFSREMSRSSRQMLKAWQGK